MTDIKPDSSKMKRAKATRINEDSIFYNRVVPILLISLGVITILLFLAAIAVLLGIF